MKALKIGSLGIAIWVLTLLWPEINSMLMPPVMIGLALTLGAASLTYILTQHLDLRHNDNNAGQDRPSQPIPVILAR
jgi:hypothetical protein